MVNDSLMGRAMTIVRNVNTRGARHSGHTGYVISSRVRASMARVMVLVDSERVPSCRELVGEDDLGG